MHAAIDISAVRQDLEERLRRVSARAERLAHHHDAQTPDEPKDVVEDAQPRTNDLVVEELGARSEGQRGALQAAIDRIDAGTYGTCARCEQAIEPKRLAAMPEAVLCASCAQIVERRGGA